MFIGVLLFCECERIVANDYFIEFFIEIFQNSFQRVWVCVCVGKIRINCIYLYEQCIAVFLLNQLINARLNEIYGFSYVFFPLRTLDNRNNRHTYYMRQNYK